MWGNALTASVRDLTGGETYDFAVRAYSGARTDTAGTAATHEVVIGHLGSVTLGSNNVLATPTVGDVLTATLADDDDMISGQRWQWERTDDDADEGWTSIGTDMNSYELAEEDVGEQVRVTVTYTDSHGPNKSAASDPTAAVLPANRPPVITTNTEEATNPSVEENSKDVYTYMATDPDGDTILWSLGTENDEALFTLDSAGQLAFRAAPNYEELDSDHPGYTVNVIASDGSLSATLTVTVTVEDMDEPPVITAMSDDPPQVAEDTAVVGSYTASDPDGDPVTWLAITSTGTDKDAFELTGTDTDAERTLQFKADALPNYEVKNSYTVTLQVQSAPEGDGDLVQSGSLEVTVAVTNEDDPGEVTLSSTAPQVGKKLIATLRDEDGQIVVDRWSWERFPEPFGAQGTSGLAVGEYTPSAGEVGQYLRVTVYYSDGHGATKQAQSVQTEAVVDVPGTPQLTADPGDEQVALTWTPPSLDGGSPILRYHVRYYKADKSDQAEAEWHEVPGGAAAQDTTIKELANSTAYAFQVLAENAVGRGVPAEVPATPKPPVCSLAGPFTATVAENTPTTEAVATYRITGDGCGAASWLALAGTDQSAFALQGSGASRTLHFRSAPNYEAKRSYVVTVRIHWGSTALYRQVFVSVSDVEEAGTVVLSSTAPQVGTALTATLSDPDGDVSNLRWSWLYFSASGTAEGTAVPGEEVAGANGTALTSTFTPSQVLTGVRLRARALYDDGHGPGKSAESVQTDPVKGPPPAPELEAEPGDGQVALTWTAPSSDGGSPILRYQVRYYKADLSDQAEAGWHEVPGGAAARDTTIAGLTNDTAYIFQVLAENAVGRSVPAEVPATPKPPVCSLAGPFTATVAENTPTTEAVATYRITGDGCGAASWLALAGTDQSAFALQGSGASRTLHFRSVPDYEAKRSYEVTVRIHWGSTALYRQVLVSVSDVEEAGQVALTGGLPPQAGRAVVAQLTDPDGQITGASWTWQRRSSATSSWEAVASGAAGTSDGSSSELSSYTPQAQDVGWQVRATVAYTDRHGPDKSAQSDASAAILGKPGVPQDLEADPGDRQVALSWSAPSSDGGSSILRYHVRYYKADLSDQAEAEWHEVPGGATARDTTLAELANSTAYVFQVLAENEVGRGAWAEKEATPKAPVCSMAGPTAATVAENTPTTTAVGTYTLSGKDCGVAVWLTLGGTDQSAFALQGSGTARTLHFLAAPDYETKNSYEVKVRVQVGSEERSVAATVTVSNVEEAGAVELTGGLPPQEDRAVVAQLTDPDGQITGASWTWQRRSSASSSWEAVSSGAFGTSEGSAVAELSRYKPLAQDVGWQVRATVAYTDGQGPNKSAQSDASATVIGKPGKPQDLEADPGDEQVALTWSAAEANGSPIQRYHVRYYEADLSDQAEAEWHEVPGGTTARDTTIAELPNKTAYVFQVLAENAVGRGAWAEAEATPQAPVCSMAGPTAATVAENTPTTTALGTYTLSGKDCGVAVWLTLGGTDQSAFQLQGSGTSRTLHFLAAPDYETKNSYEVTVRVQVGSEERSVAVTVTVSNVEEAGQVALTGGLPPQEDRAVVAQLTDPDGQVTGASWTWQRRSSETSSWEAVPSGASGTAGASSAELSSYTPQAQDVGWQVRATVTYTDGHGPNKSQHSDASAAILGKPGKPQDLEADPGDEQVALSWSAPASDGGSSITGYAYRYSTDGGTTWERDWPTQADVTTTSAVVDGLINETTYTFQVRAHNNVGAGPAAQETATPEASNQAPTLTGPTNPSGNENSTSSLGTYTARDSDGDGLEWSLAGTDASAFELKEPGAVGESASEETRTLHFRSAPNYEAKSAYAVTVEVSDGSLSANVAVSVSVTNVDEAGSVSLSSTAPQVGTAITATLSDPDGNVSNLRWSWLYFSASGTADGTGEEVEGANGTDLTSTFTPTQVLAGRQLRARALYDDGHGTGKSAESVKTDEVLGKPGKPGSLSASPGNGQVTLSWDAADDNGSSIQHYEYRRSGGNWSTVSGGSSARSQAVTGLTNGTEYTFEVRAVNGVGSGMAASVSATPVQPNRAPSVSGPEDPSGNENSTSSLGTYTARDDDDDTLTWSLSGSDDSAFELKGSGTSRTLHFDSAPNYEAKSSYDVTVKVSDGSLSASVDVDVSVTNVEEAGTVSLSTTSPEVGSSITATLSDPDGNVSNLRWRWLRFSVSGAADEPGEEVEGANGTDLTSTYTPTQVLAGRKLRARALYDDGHGTGKRAESVKTDAILGKPGKPDNLSASPGNGQVTLSWDAADDNGSSIQHYEYRRSGKSWSTVSGGASARRQTVSSLTNGTEYTFEVRAVNGVGSGSAASVSATPIQPNRTPTLTGPEDPSGNENSTSSLGTYTASDPDDDTLTWSLAGTDKSAFQLKGSGSSRTLHFRSAPNYEAKSSYEVTVKVSDGSLSASVAVDVSVTNVEEAGSVSLSTTSPQVGSSITATLSDPDGNVSNLRWSWLRFSASDADGTGEEVEGANGTDLTSTYTPSQVLAGRKLRARALYDDGHGTGKRAQSVKTDAIIGKPGKPGNLSASPGSIYTRVDLSWTAADANGSSITDYQYQYLKSGTTSWSNWTSMGVVTSYTVSGLTSGASYEFRVRAVNGVGEGAYAQTSGRAQSRAEDEQTEDEQTEDEQTEDSSEEPAAKPVSLTTQPDSVLAALAAPNPFNPTTTLHLHLPTSGPVSLTIYNLTGQVIRSLLDESLEAGYHTFAWDGRDQHGYPVASGVYLYRLQAGQQVLVNKMALIR